MHIVLIVDSYYPNYTMNGIIAYNLIENLKIYNNITVITYKNDYKESHKLTLDNINIYRIVSQNICLKSEIDKLLRNKSSISKFLLQSLDKIRKVFFYLKRNISFVGINFGLSRSIVNKLKQINNENKIDVVITISAPFEISHSGLQFSKENTDVNLIPIQLDYFSDLNDNYYPNFMKKYRIEKRVGFEHELIEKSKAYFALKFLESTISNKKHLDKKNIIYIEHPLIKNNISEPLETVISNSSEFSLLYAGSLSKSERNPVDVLEVLRLMSSRINFKFHILHRGDCSEIINKFVRDIPGRIVNWGTVETSLSYRAIKSADVLISIASKSGSQVAGKTFDYISTGKPIIYFYYDENDINKEYFERYPLSLCLYVKKLGYHQCSSRIEKFLIDTKGKSIEFECVEQEYRLATPKYITSLIYEKIHLGDKY